MTGPRALAEGRMVGTGAGEAAAAIVIDAKTSGTALLSVPVPGGTDAGRLVSAQVASHVGLLSAGDRVVAISGADGAAFVVGHLGDEGAAPAAAAVDAARAVDRGVPTNDRFAMIADADGRPIVSVDRTSAAVTIHAAAGDLQIAAPAGRIVMEARDGIALSGGKALSLEGERMNVGAVTLGVAARDVVAAADHLSGRIGRIHLAVDRLRQTVGSLLVRAGRLISHVEGKHEIAAGTVRIVADDAADVTARRITARAEEDIVMDGERIHLG